MTAITVEDGLLRIGANRIPLIAGEIQFWRMDPETWEPAVKAACAAGVTMISTYLSWRRHEPSPGLYDFTGLRDPRLDVRGFLRICADAGVFVQLKPGPWICAEEKGGGYPDWLLARTELLVRDDAGDIVLGYNPPFQHPVPSHSDPRYLDTVDRWFAAVWRVVGDYAYPTGPVVALQLDNEPSVCFQDSMYRSDYSGASITAFRQWLRERYAGDVTAWGAAWEEHAPTGFDEAVPPRRPRAGEPAAAPRRLHDWIAFKTDATARHLSRLKSMHERLGGQDLLYTVNLVTHPVHDVPVSHASIRQLVGAATGEDHYYVPPLTTDDIHRLSRSAATARAAGEPLPWVPELQAGIWRSPGEIVEYPDPTPLEQEIWWGAAIALGFSGANLYMLSDRENWELAPLERHGGRSAFFAPIEHLVAVAQSQPEALTAATLPALVVAWHRPDAHAAYTVAGTSRVPHVDWYDAETSAAYDHWEATLVRLTELGLTYDLWDTATELTAPTGLPLVVPPRSGVAPEQLDLARSSGRRVIELAEPDVTAQLHELTACSPGIIRPEGRLPRTLVAARPLAGGLIVHVVHWGDGLENAQLELPGRSNGTLTSVTTNTVVPFRSEHADLHLAPGHQVFTLEFLV